MRDFCRYGLDEERRRREWRIAVSMCVEVLKYRKRCKYAVSDIQS